MDDMYLGDSELENFLVDLEDVVNGRIVDMPHAQKMYDVMDALSDLENSLQRIEHREDALYAAINARTLDELDHMIAEINRMRKQIDKYFDDCEEDDEPEG